MRQLLNLKGSKFELQIKWITRKTKCLHAACKICHGVYTWRETCRYAVRQIELFKALNSNLTQHFYWSVICNAPFKKFTHKILEVCFIALLMSTVNDDIESNLMHLFKNGIT